MRRIALSRVINLVARDLGYNPDRDLTPARAATICDYIERRLVEGWKHDFWREWTVTEQRAFRKAYVGGDFIQLGQEVLFNADGNYYQALQLQNGATQPPATLVNGGYVENSVWWARSLSQYQASDWVTATAYVTTNGSASQVRNPDNDQQYQCIVAHTSGASFDFTKWALLTPFSYTIDTDQEGANPIDEVSGVFRRDPRVRRIDPGELPFALNENGLQVSARTGAPPSKVWVKYRQRPPKLTVVKWVAGQAYDQGDVVYFKAPNGESDCYVSAIGNNSQPVDGVVNWILQPIPLILAQWVRHTAAGDAKKDQNQTDRGTAKTEEGHEELGDIWDREMAAQGQFETATAVTYGT